MGSNFEPGLQPIPEDEFIANGPKNGGLGFWPLIVVAVCVCLWLGGSWISTLVFEQVAHRPFNLVTNRDFSLFLWQNPQFMRVHAKKKSGYLPAFEYLDRVGLDPIHADELVVAPPEILFFYHTWDRLLRNAFTPRPVEPQAFREFLEQVKEWDPVYWPDAPPEYVDLVQNPAVLATSNLQQRLPRDVQRAFQGWLNYFKEGTKINSVRPTYQQMGQFLEKYPNYSRSYWRNLVIKSIPDYLVMEGSGNEVMPQRELSEFLKVAFYNFEQSTNPSS